MVPPPDVDVAMVDPVESSKAERNYHLPCKRHWLSRETCLWPPGIFLFNRVGLGPTDPDREDLPVG